MEPTYKTTIQYYRAESPYHNAVIGFSIADAMDSGEYYLVPIAIVQPYLYIGYSLYRHGKQLLHYWYQQRQKEEEDSYINEL